MGRLINSEFVWALVITGAFLWFLYRATTPA